MKKTILAILIFFSMANIAWANGSHGQYFEKTAGEYTIGIGTDVYTLVAGDPIRFDLNLYKKESKEPIEFSDIWVRIVEKKGGSFDRTIFAGGIHNPQFGYAGMTSILPNQGQYELIVIFNNKDGNPITDDISFLLTVDPGTVENAKDPWRNAIISGMISFISGVAITLFLKRKKQP